MASKLYGPGAHKIATQQLNLLTATVKVAALKNSYVADLQNHEFYDDISAHVLGTPQTLANKSFTIGAGKVVFDADDIIFAELEGGFTIAALALWVDTGNPATSPLVMHNDSVSVLPFGTSGGALQVIWDNTVGGNGIFSF